MSVENIGRDGACNGACKYLYEVNRSLILNLRGRVRGWRLGFSVEGDAFVRLRYVMYSLIPVSMSSLQASTGEYHAQGHRCKMQRYLLTIALLLLVQPGLVSGAGLAVQEASNDDASENTEQSAAVYPRQPIPKPYRVIFNCDGNAVRLDANGDIDQWIENLFGPLANSHVDAIFWCDGSGGNTANYDSQVLELTGHRIDRIDPHLKRWIEEGNDPPKVVVREARKRHIPVFYSLRMNDTHDAFGSATNTEFPTFKQEHPDWLIHKGKPSPYKAGQPVRVERKSGRWIASGPYGRSSSLDFAVPEVRELKFRTIEEIFRKYDFDGLEVDWMRKQPYFAPGTEPENAHFLTEMLGRIRKHLNQRGEQRGRPIHLAVRVDENIEACRLDGFDVAAWIDNGLVDIVALGSGVLDIEVEQFKQLAAGKGVLVYPCLYGWPSKYYPIPAGLARGMALNYWQQGADGIYVFNWFPHTHNNSEPHGAYAAELLKQIGDAEVLKQQKKWIFAAERGRPLEGYVHNWMSCTLPANLSIDTELEVELRVGVDIRNIPGAPLLKLRLNVENLHAGDAIQVVLNGHPVDGLRHVKDNVSTVPLQPNCLILGTNNVRLKLAIASPESVGSRVVKALELGVTFPD